MEASRKMPIFQDPNPIWPTHINGNIRHFVVNTWKLAQSYLYIYQCLVFSSPHLPFSSFVSGSQREISYLSLTGRASRGVLRLHRHCAFWPSPLGRRCCCPRNSAICHCCCIYNLSSLEGPPIFTLNTRGPPRDDSLYTTAMTNQRQLKLTLICHCCCI